MLCLGASPLFILKENPLNKDKDYNNNTYEKFSKVNRVIRGSSIVPSAFSKIENEGVVGKVASSVGEKLI